jgi:hypothetical protein
MPVTGTVMEATELKSDYPSSRKIGSDTEIISESQGSSAQFRSPVIRK